MLQRSVVAIVGAVAVVGVLAILVLVERAPAPVEAVSGSAQLDEQAGRPAFTGAELGSILAPIAAEIAAGAFPGAAIAVGKGDGEIHLLQHGFIGWTPNAPPVDASVTMYDLASVTKVVATASAVMLLVDDGLLSLDDSIARFFPEFAEGPKSSVTVRHLLTHTSGLPAGATLLGDNRAARIARAKTFPIYPPAGARVEYSDVGFILLWEAAEQAAGEPLTEYLQRKLYSPLGMTSTRFSPGLDCESCAPTGRLRDQSLYRGRPFDPLGQRLDGVGGNSGLFSTAHDLGRFLAMVAAGGTLDGVRVMSEDVVREFIAVQPFEGPYRLGWEDVCGGGATESGESACVEPLAIGHTGWTGTAIYLDPRSGVWLALLTNRTYEPRAENRLSQIRRDALGAAIRSGSGAAGVDESRPDGDAPVSDELTGR